MSGQIGASGFDDIFQVLAHDDALPGGGTRAVRGSRSRSIDDNWLLDMLGEHKKVLDLGINLSTPVLELRSLRSRCR